MSQKPELYVDYYFISKEEYNLILGFYGQTIDDNFIQITGYEDLGYFVKTEDINTPDEIAMVEKFDLPIYYFNRSTEPAIPLPGE